ncbi:MAG TPA: hypothetical protein VHA06_00455 [Candidatus Angelobacter sp.]|nr:hypothetical protein [Candidatus Angelobacter sp.]
MKKLSEQIGTMQKENRRKRLDAGEHTLLESLQEKMRSLKAEAKAKVKAAVKGRGKKKRKTEEPKPEEPRPEEQEEKTEPFDYLPVVAVDSAKVDKDVYERLKHSIPFTPHLTVDGEWIPTLVIRHEGNRAILPLANLVMDTNEFRVAQHVQGSDFTRANLTLLPEPLELEIVTTPKEYQREQLCRRDALKKKKS